MQNALQFATDGITHLFFPHLCAGCGTDILHKDQLLCLECMDKLPITNFHLHANNPVEKIFWGRLPLVSAMSYLFFTKDSILQHLLHQFKYKGKKEIGLYFGRRMGEAFLQSNRFNKFDGIVPLPLFAQKERKRGYNQAEIIATGIAEILSVPVLNNLIQRTVATETQTHKSRLERWHNIEGKFEVTDKTFLEDKHLLLIDDVVTTGATLESCGLELLEHPSSRLSIATLAYTSL